MVGRGSKVSVGGEQVMRVEQVKACLCLEMGFQRRWGGLKSTSGETSGCTLFGLFQGWSSSRAHLKVV